MILKIGHRGACGHAPENSLASIQKALELECELIEFDLRMTKDHQLILAHDEIVILDDEHKRSVKEHTLEELRELPLNTGAPIPTLADVVALVGDKSIYKIDIKDEAACVPLLEYLETHNLVERVVLTGPHHEAISAMKNKCPQLKIALGNVMHRKLDDLIDYATKYNFDVIDMHYLLASKEFITILKEHGFEVHIWTVNDIWMLDRIRRMGPTAITSDYPERI